MLTFFKKPAVYIFLIPLLIGLFLLFWPENPERLKEQRLRQVENNLRQELFEIELEGQQLLKFLDQEQLDFTAIFKDQHHSFSIYQNGVLIYWNNYHVVPEYRFIRGNYDYQFLRLPRGQYIARKWENREFEVVGLIPLHEEFRIKNQYLRPHYNKSIFPFTPEKITEATYDEGYDVCIGEKCLFQINFERSTLIPDITPKETAAAVLLIFSYLAGIWMLFFYRRYFYKSVGIVKGNLLIASCMIIPRIMMLLFDFPRSYINIPLFDTTAFASSWINPTLGDLLLNFIVILLLVILLFDFRNSIVNFINGSRYKYIWLIFLSFTYYLASILLFLLIQTIYHNSQISLDINQSLSFDSLRIAVYLLLVIVTVIIFLIGHIVILAIENIAQKDITRLGILGTSFIFFIVVGLVDNVHYIIPVLIATVIMLITMLTQLYRSMIKIRFATYIYVFSWAVASALIIGYATLEFEEEQEYENQIRFAERFLIENDALAEYLLHDINQKIANDLFIQSRLSSPYLGKDVVKDKIRQVYLSGYFDKYDVDILLFDAQGRPYDPQNFMLRPADIRTKHLQYQTDHSNIYYIDDPDDEISGRYLNLIEVKKRGIRVGYILLDLRLKKIIPENVYPELLVDNRFLQPFQNKIYSYALFNDGQIIYSSGRFNYGNYFPGNLLKGKEIFEDGVEISDYQHLAVKESEDSIYVISVPAHSAEHFFSNFAFFFLLVVFVVIIISLIYAIYYFMRGLELYYSAKIQLYLSLAFFIPMLIVTVITLTLVSRSFKEEVNREYEKKAENMARNMANELENTPYENQLVNLLLRASRYANADANIFSPTGKLAATSQPMIYENNLLAPYINPLALIHIRDNKMQLYTAREAVGSLDFNTTYHEIRSPETGNLLGILSVPYFQSEAALERNRIDIFTSIISIFTIIFLLFLLISYLASEYLIFPLKIITRKLQKTSLEFNEPLSWDANDEIGLMVKEYNRMVMNLEESKKALARTEKESAWREMAQQVAHEIKNPLTPMKLTLQHLQRTISTKDEKWKRSINTLLHQVDTLSEIASSFSAFARMPAPAKERFDLQKLVQKTISLFANTEGINIIFISVRKKLIVEADEQLMGRIVSNIIINAIESGEGYQPLEITIKVEHKPDNSVLLSIADNGPGIEENVREKIFTPHFSTKKTGSGIGLAIARRGVEHAGGEIWFETEEGKGTTFYIMLPLVDAI